MKKRAVSLIICMAMVGTIMACGNNAAPLEVVDEAPQAISVVEESTENEETDMSVSEGNSDAPAGEEEKETVTTGGYPWINSDIKENVTPDMEVSPKDDFHLYVNKGWLLENDIPDGYTIWSHYHERETEIKKQCMELLKDETIEGHDAEVVRTYNNLLLDWNARNEAGYTDIKEGYEKILEASSVEDISGLITDKDTAFEYYNFMAYAVRSGLNDPSKYLLCVDTPTLILKDSAEYFNRTEIGDIYYNSGKELFSFMSGKLGMSSEDAVKYFDAAIELEGKLSGSIYTTMEKKGEGYLDKVNNEMSFEELAALSVKLPIATIIEAVGYKYDGIYLVTTPDYFKTLDEVYTDDNLDGIKGILLFNYFSKYAKYLDKETYDKTNELNAKYLGTSGTLSDKENAYNIVTDLLPVSMQKVYIAKYGSEEDKKRMEDLCQQVIDTYRELLNENSWASDEVKKKAIEKLDKIAIHAAYPDKFRDTSDIDISDCSLIEATRRIWMAETKHDMSCLGQNLDKDMWAEGFNILTCNAGYDPSANTINMIIGMMGEPFYSSDMDVEEMYASIGAFWVGHEVSHAFDNYGSQFDAEGKYKDWWTEDDKAEFMRRVKKLDDYLDSIVVFGDYNCIGTNIDTEMVADITGLQCALRMASKVDGFNYDKFFTKYAQINANLAIYSSELTNLLQDEHPRDYLRTNVPVQQFDEFYETYDVREGDNMYLAPEDRLLIW